MGKRRVDYKTYRHILQMREEGFSYRAIAKKLELPVATVHYNATVVPQHDVDIRMSCGTEYGYQQHLKRDELACISCVDAHALKKRDTKDRLVWKEASVLEKTLFEGLDL